MKPHAEKYGYERENVQQQERGDDCGPFALANFVEVLDGRDLRSENVQIWPTKDEDASL